MNVNRSHHRPIPLIFLNQTDQTSEDARAFRTLRGVRDLRGSEACASAAAPPPCAAPAAGAGAAAASASASGVPAVPGAAPGAQAPGGAADRADAGGAGLPAAWPEVSHFGPCVRKQKQFKLARSLPKPPHNVQAGPHC